MRLPLTSTVAGIYNNLGNLELATGNTDEASSYYDKALQIWVEGGDDTASHLALTYLCVGRVHMLCGELKEANKLTSQAEALLLRTTGEGKGFMAK
jgi:tetratricopeptide (TPR) repeat protein